MNFEKVIFQQKIKSFAFNILMFISLCILVSCTDPVIPEFQFEEELVHVDAYVSTAKGDSYAIITKTTNLSGTFKDLFVKEASVSFRNIDTNREVFLIESIESYIAPTNFQASIGETWELLIKMPDGRTYRSKPETIIEPVGFSNLKASYSKELVFNENENAFFPGHTVSIDFNDPGGDKNYYFWKYRSFEKISICSTCFEEILRGGECNDSPVSSLRGRNLTYACDTNCWQIRYNEDVRIFSDDFINGNSVKSLPVADVVLYTKNNIVIEVQQYSLSPAAYKYYKVLKDLVDNNVGFNAPPPAALVGNMFNPNDNSEFVLGRFTAASAVVKSIFINRSRIAEDPVERIISVDNEKCTDICTAADCMPFNEPLPPECVPVISTSCDESRFRTGIRPEGWID